jgi:uncharacterized protein (DUF4415 family)
VTKKNSKPKVKSPKKPSKPKSPKLPKLPPKVIVSARVSTDVKKALAAVGKRLKHDNISETVAKAIDYYLNHQGDSE